MTQQFDGRDVYTRADLIAAHQIGLSTLQLLYRERADTGHPEAVGKIGRSLVWDATEWDTWYEQYRTRTTPIGQSPAPTGPAAGGSGAGWQGVTVPGVDYSGNADDLLTLAQGARVLGLAPNTVTVYANRPPEGWPEPDQYETRPDGRVHRRRYRRRRFWEYAAHRQRHPGGGRPAGSTTGARAYPYEGDPRLDLARTALDITPVPDHGRLPVDLADQHGGTPGTWAAILSSARQHPAGDDSPGV
jgi:hypothetical protein